MARGLGRFSVPLPIRGNAIESSWCSSPNLTRFCTPSRIVSSRVSSAAAGGVLHWRLEWIGSLYHFLQGPMGTKMKHVLAGKDITPGDTNFPKRDRFGKTFLICQFLLKAPFGELVDSWSNGNLPPNTIVVLAELTMAPDSKEVMSPWTASKVTIWSKKLSSRAIFRDFN